MWFVHALGLVNALLWSVLCFSGTLVFFVVAGNSVARWTWLLAGLPLFACIIPTAVWTDRIFTMNALTLFFMFTGLAAFRRVTTKRIVMCGAVATALTLSVASFAGFLAGSY